MRGSLLVSRPEKANGHWKRGSPVVESRTNASSRRLKSGAAHAEAFRVKVKLMNRALRRARWIILGFVAVPLLLVGALFLSESLQLTFASHRTIAEYHFGSESMVGHGGWSYRTRWTYVASCFIWGLPLFAGGLLVIRIAFRRPHGEKDASRFRCREVLAIRREDFRGCARLLPGPVGSLNCAAHGFALRCALAMTAHGDVPKVVGIGR